VDADRPGSVAAYAGLIRGFLGVNSGFGFADGPGIGRGGLNAGVFLEIGSEGLTSHYTSQLFWRDRAKNSLRPVNGSWLIFLVWFGRSSRGMGQQPGAAEMWESFRGMKLGSNSESLWESDPVDESGQQFGSAMN